MRDHERRSHEKETTQTVRSPNRDPLFISNCPKNLLSLPFATSLPQGCCGDTSAKCTLRSVIYSGRLVGSWPEWRVSGGCLPSGGWRRGFVGQHHRYAPCRHAKRPPSRSDRDCGMSSKSQSSALQYTGSRRRKRA